MKNIVIAATLILLSNYAFACADKCLVKKDSLDNCLSEAKQDNLSDRRVVFVGRRSQEFIETAKCYRKAADQGNVMALYHLGHMHHSHPTRAGGLEEALKWYRKAADYGNAEAQNSLGFMHHYGQGVTKDFEEAVKWYTKAAEQGYANAQDNLGAIYYHGLIVNQDYKEALKWFSKAAEQGNVNSQDGLGVMYYNGEGVIRDYKRAYMWFFIAAKNNHRGAVEIKRIMEVGMAQSQIEEAEDMAQKWMAAHR